MIQTRKTRTTRKTEGGDTDIQFWKPRERKRNREREREASRERQTNSQTETDIDRQTNEQRRREKEKDIRRKIGKIGARAWKRKKERMRGKLKTESKRASSHSKALDIWSSCDFLSPSQKYWCDISEFGYTLLHVYREGFLSLVKGCMSVFR